MVYLLEFLWYIMYDGFNFSEILYRIDKNILKSKMFISFFVFLSTVRGENNYINPSDELKSRNLH